MSHWFERLFASAPFRPLIEHQKKVAQCAALLPETIEAALGEDQEQLKVAAKKLSHLEFEADEIKTQVRDKLPKSIFMPVSRADLLHVLSAQDSIADAAEDVGVLLTMRPLSRPPDEVVDALRAHVASVTKVVERATEVVEQLDKLARTSFAGPAADRVLKLIDTVDREEHLADKVQDQLAKAFYRHEDAFKPAEIFLWIRIFEKIGAVANHAEKMTHRVRLFMAA